MRSKCDLCAAINELMKSYKGLMCEVKVRPTSQGVAAVGGGEAEGAGTENLIWSELVAWWPAALAFLGRVRSWRSSRGQLNNITNRYTHGKHIYFKYFSMQYHK